MSKKIVSILLAMMMIATSLISAGAYYKPGEKSHMLTFDECINVENATVSSRGAVTVTDSGSVTYDALITFPIGGIEFRYEAQEDTSFTLTADGIAYGGVLSADNKSYSHTLSSVIAEGQRVFKITFDKTIKVTSITLTAKRWKLPDAIITDAKAALAVIGFTTAEELVHSAVIVDERASAIMVNGATRYIDNDNITLKPRYFGGNLCLPIHTLARALGYYYEDMPEHDFTLMRYEDTEFVLKNGVMTKENEAGITDATLPIYRDAYGTWAGIRFFSEAIGETVVYDNGTVYIDYKSQIKKIRESAAAKAHVVDTLGAFEEEQTAGKTYYVAQTANASDKNPGTEEAPFKTLNKAGQVAKAGDTVIIKAGTYREVFTPQNDGTATNPIVFKAAEGEEVVISANEIVDDFLPYGDKGWVCAHLPKDLGFGNNQIFYNSEGIIEARYPNGNYYDMGEGNEPLSEYFHTRGSFLVDDTDYHLVTSPDGLLEQEEKDVWKGAIFMSAHGNMYTTCSAFVESSEKGSLRIGKTSQRWWWDQDINADGNNSGYLQGVEACMDLPGEWIVENNTLIMIPPEGETAKSLVVEAKVRQLVADLDEREYVHLKGIKTIGGSITMNESQMCMLDNVDMNYISHFTFIDDAREGFLDGHGNGDLGSNSPMRGEVGIWLEGKNNIIKDSTFDHSGGAALYISGLYAYVENNKIINCGYAGSYVGGIYVFPNLTKSATEPRGGFAIYENDISRSARSCFALQAPEGRSGWDRIAIVPFEIAYNRLYDSMLSTLDTANTYIYQANMNTDRVYSKLHSNYSYVTHNEQLGTEVMIYFDNGCEGVYCFNNMIFAATDATTLFYETMQEHETGNADWIGANMMLDNHIIDGPDSLKAEWFLNAKPFYAGLADGRAAYMKNYAYEGNYVKIDASDAKLSGGATLDNKGRIRFNSKTALATFENVDFGNSGLNRMDIYFAGTRQVTWPALNIKIGDTYETAETFTTLARSEHYSNEALVNVKVWPGTLSGVSNVYLEAVENTDESFAVSNIIFNDAGKDYGIRDGSRVYFAEYTTLEKIGNITEHPRASGHRAQHKHGFLTYLWGSKMKYKYIKIPENSNYIAIYVGVKEPYDSMELIFTYLKDGVEKRIGVARTPNVGWTTNTIPVYLEIPPEVAADISGQVVDICVEAGKTLEGNLATCDAYWFDFLEERIEPEVTDGATVYGGDFSWIVAQGDDTIPPRRRLTNGRDTTPFANNVWSGSTLLYENIAVDKDAKRLYCTTGAEEEYAGQAITFRYAKKNETKTKVLGTFVTTANGLETDSGMEYIKLPTDFEAGEVDIYVDFGNAESGKKATCNFFKFGFTK